MFCCIQFPEWVVGEVDIPRRPYSALRILIKPIHKEISLHDNLKIRLKSDLFLYISYWILIILSSNQLSLKQIRIWICFYCFLPLKELFFNIPPFFLEVVKNFLTSQHHIIKIKRISLQSDSIFSFSRAWIFTATILFENINHPIGDTVNDSDMSVFSSCLYNDISLHKIVRPLDFLPICKKWSIRSIFRIP